MADDADLTSPGRRRRLHPGVSVVVALFAVVVTTAALHVLGVGGYRAGELIVAITIAAVGVGAVLALVPAGVRGRGLIAVAMLVVGFVAGSLIAPRAPLSTGRLTDRLDDVELESFEAVDTERHGHSWCRPRCPVVERIYRAPNIVPRAAVVLALVALWQADLAPNPAELDDRALRGRVAVRGPEHRLFVEGHRVDDSEVRVVVRLEAKRR